MRPLSTFSGNALSAQFNVGIRNIDPGAPGGTLALYSFAGDGNVSNDEWNVGSLFHTFTGINGGNSTQSINIGSLLSSSIAAGDNYLSFNLRTTDSDRYWLNKTVSGTTSSISGEGPTWISVRDSGSTFGLLGLGIVGLVGMRRRFAK